MLRHSSLFDVCETVSRYQIQGEPLYEEAVVGCDEHLGTLFLHAAQERNGELELSYPRLETMRELRLLLAYYALDVSSAVLRQLAGELAGKPARVWPRDHVIVQKDGERLRHLVLAATRTQLLVTRSSDARWVNREAAELDPGSTATEAEHARVTDHLASDAAFDGADDGPPPVVLKRRSSDAELAAHREADAALLERLLGTRGLFQRG